MAQLAGFLAVFIISLFNLVPVIYGADSPLFTTSSFYLSTAHPPGYPLFASLGKLLTFLPFGSIGYKTNLVSALASSFSYYLLFKLIERITRNRPLAFSFSFLPLLTPLMFSESVKAEAFALNASISLLILYLGLKALEEKDFRFMYAVFFLFGVGSGDHHTVSLLFFPVMVSLIALFKKNRKPIVFLWLALFFLAGFLINAQIYLRSLALGNTGFTYSLMGSFQDFLDIFFRRDYSVSSLQALGHLGNGYMLYFSGIRNAFNYVIIKNYGLTAAVFFVISVILLLFLKEKASVKAYLILAIAPWVFFLPKLTFGGNPPERTMEIVSRFFLPVITFIPILISVPLSHGYLFIKKHAAKASRFAALFLLVPLLQIPSVIPETSSRDNYLAYDRGRDMLTILPVESWVLIYGDNPAFTTMYMQWIERYREDVAVFNKVQTLDSYLFRARSIFWKNKLLYADNWKENRAASYMQYDFKPEKTDEMVRRGKLFASDAAALTTRLQNKYGSDFALMARMLKVKHTDISQKVIKFSLANLYKLNYERAEAIQADNNFCLETKNLYGFSILSTLPYLQYPAQTKSLETASIRLLDPKRFLPYYAHIQELEGNTQQTFSFLHWIEANLPGSDMANMAHVLEYVMLSKTDSKTAEDEYAYLEKKGLLIYIPDMKSIVTTFEKEPDSDNGKISPLPLSPDRGRKGQIQAQGK